MPCLSFLVIAFLGMVLGAGLNLAANYNIYLIINKHAAAASNVNVDNAVGPQSSPSSWDDVKNRLCPKSVPQIKYGHKLFDLARQELGLRNTKRNQTEEDRFFAHPPEVSAYYHPDSGAYNVSMIYIDNKKAASTSIRHHFRSMGYQQLETRDLKSILNQDVIPVASDVCVVTAVRDPIERFLSGYTELAKTVATIQNSQTSQTSHTEHDNGDLERFEDFMKDFLTHPGFLRIGGNKERLYEYTEFLRHLYLQSRILSLVNEAGVKLNYLPSIENIHEEWPRFLTENCPSASKILGNHPGPMSMMRQQKSSRNEFSAWELKGPSAKALCYLQAMDYACFDELPNGVHKLCKEIYSSDKFRLTWKSNA